MKGFMLIELLEARVAPATLAGHNVITYTDTDGDHVTVKFSKPLLTDAAEANAIFTFDTGTVSGSNLAPQVLEKIDLSAGGFDKVGIVVTVTPGSQGDGFASVGAIDSTGHDLGAVSVHGDLGRIAAGDANLKTPGLASLQVISMGAFGVSTQAAGGDLNSTIKGSLGQLSITANLDHAYLETTGAGAGVKSIFIGGSMLGTGMTPDAGGIKIGGDIGKATINGDLAGGAGDNSGGLQAANIGSVTVGGSLLGGDGASSAGFSPLRRSRWPASAAASSGAMWGSNSGGVTALTLKSIVVEGSIFGGAATFSGGALGTALLGSALIGGDVIGGAGNYSGSVGSYSTVGSVFIGGSLKGPTLSTGMVSVSGEIVALGAIQSVTILGDLRGGTITGDAHLSDSGYIAATVIGHVTIGGSVIAGTDNSASGSLVNTGAIRAIDTLGSVKIGENMLGTTGTGGVVTQAAISAGGIFNSHSTLPKGPDLAIARLTIGGNVEHASIEAGVPNVVIASFGFSSPANADAQIGPVSVGGEWLASNPAAGAAATDGFYGDTNDAKLSGSGVRDQADHFSKIASITIAGQIFGTATPGDNFGFVAQQFGAIRIGGTLFPLTVPHRSLTADVAIETIPSP